MLCCYFDRREKSLAVDSGLSFRPKGEIPRSFVVRKIKGEGFLLLVSLVVEMTDRDRAICHFDPIRLRVRRRLREKSLAFVLVIDDAFFKALNSVHQPRRIEMKQRLAHCFIMVWFVLCIVFVVGGCAGGGSGPSSGFTIVSVTPSKDATGVAVTSAISATFSSAIDTSTLRTSTFKLSDVGGLTVPGTIAYDATSKTATFTPTVPLSSNVTYTAKITTGVITAKTAEGKSTGLSADYTWQFTTGSSSRPLLYLSNRALDGSDAANVNNTANIWQMNADGTGSKPLTSLTAVDAGTDSPQWSPDGTKVVFDSRRNLDGSDAGNTNPTYNIWVMNADGTNPKPLTSITAAGVDSYVPRWSPDGTRIVYYSRRNLDGSDGEDSSNFNIWTVHADGSNAKPLAPITAMPKVNSVEPQWSPDGTKVVFDSVRKLDGSDASNINATYNIWVVNADGINATPLTSLTAEGFASGRAPQWSPDGTKIVFYSGRKLDGTDAVNLNHASNIWVMNADGSNVKPLTSLTAAHAESTSPLWSPDGTKIVFTSSRKLDGTDAANVNNTVNIWVMNADGSGAKPLTSLTAADANNWRPQWSQDGTLIVYGSWRSLDGADAASTNNVQNVWVMQADGSGAKPLTALTAAGVWSGGPMW